MLRYLFCFCFTGIILSETQVIVDPEGTDDETCLEDKNIHCKSLTYVFSQITENIDVTLTNGTFEETSGINISSALSISITGEGSTSIISGYAATERSTFVLTNTHSLTLTNLAIFRTVNTFIVGNNLQTAVFSSLYLIDNAEDFSTSPLFQFTSCDGISFTFSEHLIVSFFLYTNLFISCLSS